MATYAIGDIHDQVITVLGNHDLHLLACYYGVRKPTKKDTFTEVLASPECDTLLDWLRQQPLLHHDASLGYTLTHAGIPPIWTIAQARSYAREVETALRSIDPSAFFNTMYGNEPATWSTSLEGTDRLRTITNYLTRMRFCAPDGKLEFATKSGPEAPPPGYLPWYLYPEHLCTNERLLFGHWAALSGDTGRPNFVGLDTGCVWGGELSLMRLEDGQRYCVDCAL